jgi:hypothetical protein
MPAANYLGRCCCSPPRAAGATLALEAAAPYSVAQFDAATPYSVAQTERRAMPELQVIMETPEHLLRIPEGAWPIGSKATLFAPFQVDRGLWVQPRLVTEFVKTPNGRWTSYPGNDVNYPTLLALSFAVPVMDVWSPAQPAPEAAGPLPTRPAPGEPVPAEVWYPDDRPPAPIPLDAPAPKPVPWLLLGIAAAAAWLLLGRRS